jgi:hypothetical protein
LLGESNGLFHWVGVNTWADAEGVKFAISSDDALAAKYTWATCGPYGAAHLIRQLRNIKATIER